MPTDEDDRQRAACHKAACALLEPRVAHLEQTAREALGARIESFLMPLGPLGNRLGEPLQKLAPHVGQRHALRKARDSEDEDVRVAAEQVLLRSVDHRSLMEIMQRLNRGEFDPSNPDELQRVADEVEAETSSALEAEGLRGGHLRKRKGKGQVGPPLQDMVWPLYQLLIDLYYDRPGRGEASQRGEDPRQTRAAYPQKFPPELLQLIALLIESRWVHVIGSVSPGMVGSQVQQLHKKHPDVWGRILADYERQGTGGSA